MFGTALGILVMFVNGFFSPWGFAGLMLPFQMAGMMIVGVGGGLYDAASCVETAVLGASLTHVYDLITNFVWAISGTVVAGYYFAQFKTYQTEYANLVFP